MHGHATRGRNAEQYEGHVEMKNMATKSHF